MKAAIGRREFITLLGTAAAWPIASHAQQNVRMRRLGVLVYYDERDPEGQSSLAAFRQALEKLGWSAGRNIEVRYRYSAPGTRRDEVLAKELVAFQPDVIFAHSTAATAALQRETRTIPIVFAAVSDPVGSGFVANLARPNGNLTGFLFYEASITGKWLTMLKEVLPQLERVGMLINPKNGAYAYWRQAAESIAPSVAVELLVGHVENAADIEREIETFARTPNVGLFLPPDFTVASHRDLIAALAVRHRMPTVSAYRDFVDAGGLMSYGVDGIDQFRQAATYVDRILRGEKPADLPVQAPVKYETVLNLKTARALGLDVPSTMLVRADEVIE
jgi:putative ABC transport system substrate-binding protein